MVEFFTHNEIVVGSIPTWLLLNIIWNMNLKSSLLLSNTTKSTKFLITRSKYSKKFLDTLAILLKEGYIRGYFLNSNVNNKSIFILQKYVNEYNLLSLKNISVIKQKYYLSAKYLKKHFKSFNNLIILSTKKGIISHIDAVYLNIGGFPILHIF